MMRRLAPKTAMTVAEYFRDRGQSVLLIVDSVTRFAHAARDVALAAGEPAVARGYAPSVFSDLPRLLERAGPGAEGSGSITGVFSVLVDGDDHNDPVADNIRGTLDGHIVLDRAIADQGRYPAVNVLTSISRIPQPKWTPEQRALVTRLRGLIARFEETRELRLMGGYTAGADPVLDQAVKTVPRIYDAMTQSPRTRRCATTRSSISPPRCAPPTSPRRPRMDKQEDRWRPLAGAALGLAASARHRSRAGRRRRLATAAGAVGFAGYMTMAGDARAAHQRHGVSRDLRPARSSRPRRRRPAGRRSTSIPSARSRPRSRIMSAATALVGAQRRAIAWLREGNRIFAVHPGDDVPRLGRVGGDRAARRPLDAGGREGRRR